MGFNLYGRVRETTLTEGTGAYALEGAVTGHRAFGDADAYDNADTLFALIVAGAEWEMIKGTYATSGDTVARTQVYKSTNGDAAVDWGAGVKEIFVVWPAPQDLDAAGRALLMTALGGGGGGGYVDLKIDYDGADDGTITATRFPIETTGGSSYMARAVSVAFDLATTGAGGLDTGTASTGWYYLFIIYNPATGLTAALASLSATAPTMPSGYTYKGRVGTILYGRVSFQRGDLFKFEDELNPTNADGVTDEIDISDVVPPTAIEVWGSVEVTEFTSAGGEAYAGSIVSGFQASGSGSLYFQFNLLIQTPQKMIVSVAGDPIRVHGFRDAI